MAYITIADLVRNGTMDARMAAVLWAAVDKQMSFLTVAVPRFAGKTTTSNAVLAMRPPEVPAFLVAGESQVMEQLKQEKRGGYLIVAEFAQAPVPGYIWGPSVRRVFDCVYEGGYSLQTALHAPGVEDAILEVTQGNQVPDHHASVFKLVMYIERFGNHETGYWRRVTDLFEVFEVKNGRPVGQSLFRWNADDDQFKETAQPEQFARDRDELAQRASIIQELANSGRTSPEAVEGAIAQFRR